MGPRKEWTLGRTSFIQIFLLCLLCCAALPCLLQTYTPTNVSVGQPLTLHCWTNCSTPVGPITWTMNGREIWSQKHQAISRYKPISDQSRRTSYNFSIALSSVTLRDGGWYSCIKWKKGNPDSPFLKETRFISILPNATTPLKNTNLWLHLAHTVLNETAFCLRNSNNPSGLLQAGLLGLSKVTISPPPGRRQQALKIKATQQGKERSKDSTAKKAKSFGTSQAGWERPTALFTHGQEEERESSVPSSGIWKGLELPGRVPRSQPLGRMLPLPPLPPSPGRILGPRPSSSASGPRRTYGARRLPRRRPRRGADLGAAEGGTLHILPDSGVAPTGTAAADSRTQRLVYRTIAC
ncbi:uncharacterized protein LOC131396641 [Diceros bicornis minor]|uniref:uncharacterized protein LOC131396641 n=1 Tax=Diceros bicornis minor TaxID=77932 RepID=UPI0026F13CB3|nr:uncharacterized protein LOC131396641 [Diceros bicornis minor]